MKSPCRKCQTNVTDRYAVIEYLCKEEFRIRQIEPDRFEWSADFFSGKLHRMKVWVDDSISVEFFLDDELRYCFSVPEYFRSITRKIDLLCREVSANSMMNHEYDGWGFFQDGNVSESIPF